MIQSITEICASHLLFQYRRSSTKKAACLCVGSNPDPWVNMSHSDRSWIWKQIHGRNILEYWQNWTDYGCLSLCVIFQPTLNSSCGSKNSIYNHACVHSACVDEYFVGDLCSRVKPLSSLHCSYSLSFCFSHSFSWVELEKHPEQKRKRHSWYKLYIFCCSWNCDYLFRYFNTLTTSFSAFFNLWKTLQTPLEAKRFLVPEQSRISEGLQSESFFVNQ